jgi:hypothetical protein
MRTGSKVRDMDGGGREWWSDRETVEWWSGGVVELTFPVNTYAGGLYRTLLDLVTWIWLREWDI